MTTSSSLPSPHARKPRAGREIAARVALLLGAAGLLGAIASGLGARLGLWHFRTGFVILTWSAYGGIAAALISLAVLAWLRGSRPLRTSAMALAGLVLAFASFAYPLYLRHLGQSLPRIHDITTDFENPPAFVAVVPLRVGAENPVAYSGAATAKLQEEGYPGIATLHLAAPPAEVFKAALLLVTDDGWQVAAAVPAEGRIEATATTFWYGFKDDVVIRIAADGERTKVDMRSESRVGRSDLGVNARRVAAFLAALKGRLAAS